MSHIPPSGPESAPISSSPSNDDQEGDDMMIDLINFASGGQYSPALKQFVDSVLSQVPHPPTHLAIENAVSSIIAGTGTPPLDAYISITQQNITPPLTKGDLDTVLNQLHASAQKYGDQWSFTAPAPTGIDIAFQQVYPLLDGFTSGVQVLASGFMAMITQTWGSGGSPEAEDAMNWLDNILLSSKNILEFPSFTANELTSFIQAAYPPGTSHGAPSADFLAQYSPAVVYLQSLTPGTDDFNLFNKVFSLFAEGWTTSSLAQVVQFTQNEYATLMFSDYPNLTEAAAVKMESICGLAIPPIQHQFFETRAWIAGPPPLTGQDLDLAHALRDEIAKNWPTLKPADLTAWFNNWNASSSDIYMTYPLASDAAVSRLSQIVGQPVPPKTPMDIIYLEYKQYMTAHLQPGTNDYALYLKATQICEKGGSHDPNLSTLTSWFTKEIATAPPPFHDYQPLQQSTILTLLGTVDYKYAIQYFQSYLVFWVGMHVPQYEKDLAAKFEAIIRGFAKSHPHPTADDFKQYLDTYMATPGNDLCLAVPGISPWHINQLFNDLGISPTPYTPPVPDYPNADYAYAGACQRLEAVSSPKIIEPDYDVYLQLVQRIRDSIVDQTANPYKANVLDWVKGVVDSPTFGQLTKDSQTVLNEILSQAPIGPT